jgi:hypothetical protein
MPLNTICLVVFVKNDGRFILELFKSVLPVIDYYYVCDFNSVDNTCELITDYTKGKVRGEIIKVSDESNGSHIIKSYTGIMTKVREMAAYTLFMNADSILDISPSFDKSSITKDVYRIKYTVDTYMDYTIALVKNSKNIRCMGIHNFCFDYPTDMTLNKLDQLTIIDREFGYTRDDKRKCEISLCKYEHTIYPDKRYFDIYLARCYNDLWKLTKHAHYLERSMKWYKRRLLYEGWKEELFVAHLALGMYLRSFYHLMEAQSIDNNRAEGLYELINQFREKGKQYTFLAEYFYHIASKIKYPTHSYLSIRKDVYTYLLDYEYTIIAYYSGKPLEPEFYHKYLNIIGNGRYNNMIGNYKFYVKFLTSVNHKKITFGDAQEFLGFKGTFNPTTPSIVKYGDGYVMNQRYVNYILENNGAYKYTQPITTINKRLQLGSDMSVKEETIFGPGTGNRCGVEELKLFSHGDKIIFSGIEYDKKTKKKYICGGTYTPGDGTPMSGKETQMLSTSVQSSSSDISKWAYCPSIGADVTPHVVTCWAPFSLTKCDVPEFFKYLSSSSNGCVYGDEVWFLTNMIDYAISRIYYYCIVIIDKTTLKYKRHSILFKFENVPVEQCYGMIVEQDRIIFSYSKYERDACVYILERPQLDTNFL